MNESFQISLKLINNNYFKQFNLSPIDKRRRKDQIPYFKKRVMLCEIHLFLIQQNKGPLAADCTLSVNG